MTQYDPRERNRSRFRSTVERLFPPRHLMVRTSGRLRSVRLSTGSQVCAAALATAFAGWVAYASVSYVTHDMTMAAKEREIQRVEADYRSVLAQVQVYRDKISAVAQQLEENHSETLALTARASAGDGAGAGDIGAGDDDAALQLQLERERALRQRAALRAELSRLEQELVTVAAQDVLADNFDTVDIELRKLVLQRDLAESQAKSLRSEVATLRERLADMEDAQLEVFQRFSAIAEDRITEIEEAIGKTGLKLDQILDDGTAAQGGPLIPLDVGNWDKGALKATLGGLNSKVARLNQLNALAESLPLGRPLHDYYITSPFGPRKDPMKKTIAVHEGLDMGAPFKSPIMATGPGKVVYAGWRGRYGRMVEIDHGNGLKTRFGHMNKILVKKGDLVDRSTKIGLVGSSGRSTGPHLHYEVIVDGKPRNPYKFIKAGTNVFKD